ncbi:MAG: MerR family transcriptional regulator [Thermoanaerobaculia bacterium]
MGAKKGMRSADLCRALEIQPYVLRYWETEFQALSGEQSTGGQRTYSETDVELVRRIKQLLYEEGYTIAGAKKKLESEPFDATAGRSASLFEEEAEAGSEPEAPAAAVAAVKPDAALDSVSVERIEQLRKGIEEALATARSALELLEK